MDNIKTGKFLYELRKEKGLSQKDAAYVLGVSDKTISKWECGEGFPSIEYLINIAKFYDVTIDEIINGERKIIKEESKQNVTQSNQIPFMAIFSLVMCILGCLTFFIVMYAASSLTGSTISILIMSIIALGLTIAAGIIENKEEFITIKSINYLFLAFDLYLTVFGLSALTIVGQQGQIVYINGSVMIAAIFCFLPFLSLLGYSLYINYKTKRTFKDMVLLNYHKYIDVLIFSLCFASLISSLMYLHYTHNPTGFIIMMVLFAVTMILTLVDFILKKEIVFVFQFTIFLCSVIALMINASDLLLTLNVLEGTLAICTFAGYIAVYVLKKKAKKVQIDNQNQ